LLIDKPFSTHSALLLALCECLLDGVHDASIDLVGCLVRKLFDCRRQLETSLLYKRSMSESLVSAVENGGRIGACMSLVSTIYCCRRRRVGGDFPAPPKSSLVPVTRRMSRRRLYKGHFTLPSIHHHKPPAYPSIRFRFLYLAAFEPLRYFVRPTSPRHSTERTHVFEL
jgi:hypothetical protein